MLHKLTRLIRPTTSDHVYNRDLTIANYSNSGIDALNKAAIDDVANNPRFSPFAKRHPKCQATVNLTTFPARINDVHYTLLSLLSQSLLPERIVLWLSREEFPRGINELPDTLMRMMNCGIHIEWTRNLRSYTKLIPALLAQPDTLHVTADDDIFYHRDWLKDLFEVYQLHGDGFVYAHRAHRIRLTQYGPDSYSHWDREISQGAPSFLNFATGVGGVLYPAGCLSQQTIAWEIFMTLSPTNDDLWFWAMGVLNNRRTRVTPRYSKLVYTNPERELRLSGEFTLAQENVVNSANDQQLMQIIQHYPIILEKLFKEAT